jgi:hypothetical protein
LLSTTGVKFLKVKLAELAQAAGKERVPEAVLNELLLFLFSSHAFDAKSRDAIIRALGKAYDASSMPRLLAMVAEDPTALDNRRFVLLPLSHPPSSVSDVQVLHSDAFIQTHDMSESATLLKQIMTSLGPARVMADIGFESCADENRLRSVLRQFARLDEDHVARIVGMMAMSHGLDDSHNISSWESGKQDAASKSSSWNFEVLVNVVRQAAPQLNWDNVLKALDYPEFKLLDPKGARLIAAVYKRATGVRNLIFILVLECTY